MKRTIEEVLDEMVGANYMITAAQIEEIREIHKCEINEALITATGLAEEAYEAGRKHDRKGFEEAVDYGRKRIRFAFGVKTEETARPAEARSSAAQEQHTARKQK